MKNVFYNCDTVLLNKFEFLEFMIQMILGQWKIIDQIKMT